MSADAYREQELKLDAEAGWELPDLAALVPGGRVESETVRLVSSYFDTADRRLLGSRLTLRRRTGDTDNGWQLKVPDGDARLELRWPVGGTAVPAEIREVTYGVRGGGTLRRVATITVVRGLHRLIDADGAVLAEVADDHVTSEVLGSSRAAVPDPQSWREVEVELVDGRPKLLARAARLLIDAGAEPSASASKLGRAVGVAATADRPAGSLAALVGDYLDVQWAVIVRGDLALRQDEYPVHGTRTAIRRYRSVLREARSWFGAGAEELEQALAEFAAVLGAVRDCQVLAEGVDALVEDAGAERVGAATVEFLDAELAHEREVAEGAVQRHLRTKRHLALLAELARWHAEMPLPPDVPGSTVVEVLRRADRRARHRLAGAESAVSDAEEGTTTLDSADEAMHRARKAAKRARYVAELAGPVGGDQARAVRKAQKSVQKRLGAAQDSVVLAHFLRRAAGSATGEVAFELGILHELARAGAAQ